MKPLIFSTLPLLATLAHAQFLNLPPSSQTDGILVRNEGLNAGAQNWDDPNGLMAYRSEGDGNSDALAAGVADQHLGLTWNQTLSAAELAALANLNSSGGVIRAIFVGETAGWLNDFGYTYSGNPTQQSFTEFHQIQSIGPNPTVQFGQYIDIPLLPGAASTFDFWLNGVGDLGLSPPAGPSAHGGIYTALHPSNSQPGNASNQFLWAQSPLSVNTYVASLGAYVNVNTFLVSTEDWRFDAGSDRDYSDYRFALQFFDTNGMPLSAIPESGAISLVLGLTALGAAAATRRRAPSSH